MDRNEEEKLIDILLGEAVLVLLKEEAAISNAALIKQLKLLSVTETHVLRQRAYRLAINEVRNYTSADISVTSHDVRDRDHKRHLFNHEGPPDGTKKH
ncbi:hypothetical protein [Erwinia sp.]|uniref:hypothetical protein n=1 Tax=Erwinia citreus TaxID=558 RepID=UPI003C7505D3